MKPVYDQNGLLKDSFFAKVFLSSDPSTGNYTVANLLSSITHAVDFRLAGDDCWTSLPPLGFFADCMFEDDLMYALTKLGEIHVLFS